MRRKDLEICRALEEKRQLIAEIMSVPAEDSDEQTVDSADIAAVANDDHGKDAREVLLAALTQGMANNECIIFN